MTNQNKHNEKHVNEITQIQYNEKKGKGDYYSFLNNIKVLDTK